MTRGQVVAARVRGALAAVVRLQEALQDGDAIFAHGILAALELDLRELAYLLEREPEASGELEAAT